MTPTVISNEYRELNRQLHETNPNYGTTAPRYVNQVMELVRSINAESVLDYGCGKGLLRAGINEIRKGIPGELVAEYDPCIPGKDVDPEPADVVACLDVMEHIEPEHLTDVLRHMHSKTAQCVFLTVATRPAKKTLADGRNAHLIVQDADWWLPRLMEFFSPRLLQVMDGEFLFLGVPKGDLA